MNELNKWETISRGTTHIQDTNFEGLYGKAICGIKFGHRTIQAEVTEGSKVNCPRCLVKVGWAKKTGNFKLDNVVTDDNTRTLSYGFTETYYELVKDLHNSALPVGLDLISDNHKAGFEFNTNTENRKTT
tara:strand:+ start:542 stop:931 length:390 start_codon:yes stop_codon:yes gene_type:complete